MTYSHNTSDENDGRNDDENEPAPTPTTDWSNDDDEPPAAGACLVVSEDENEGAWISMAPKAEPKHQANPQKVITA